MRATTDKAAFVRQFVDFEAAAQIDGVAIEPYQIQFLNNASRFHITDKARQIGWSFTAALDAVAGAILEPGIPHVFVSINLDEAVEKIRYARAIIRAIRPDVRPSLMADSRTQLEFANGSRLISHPCRPPRGKARTRIYLDEMAHYKAGMDREIYTAALPATTKGDGYVRIGSSPMGASGLFWEIFTESLRKWPGYDGYRISTPWWHVHSLCRDVPNAAKLAPRMTTAERIQTFGTQALAQIFENMFLEDFQQEYECAWVDEASAWIDWEIIKRNQDDELLWWHAANVDEALAAIPQIREAIGKAQIERVFVGGVDIGRTRNLTELALVGLGTSGMLPLRFSVSLDQVTFDDQQKCLRQIIERLPITAVLVDRNGLGMQLAENLERLTGKAIGVDFTSETKELFAVAARIEAERGHVPLPVDRDTAYQIHSIKKMVTDAKHNRFDTTRNEKHHADKFWAWALAIYAAVETREIEQQPDELVLPQITIGPSI